MFNKNFLIESKRVGIGQKPFIVAELSANHNGSLERALKIVEAVATTGADAIKLQTYTAEGITIDSKNEEFVINDPKSLWYGANLFELYKKAYTPWEWHQPIFNRCRDLGLICFSSPFDESAVEFLQELKAPCYKIASFENTDKGLIEKMAATGKPLIMSTGVSKISELAETIENIADKGVTNLALLKCTSSYPANPEQSNIRTIPHMAQLFSLPVGLSDHTLGIGVALGSIALGACMIEKHVTLSRKDGGVDSAFSLEIDELKNLVVESERVWQGLGEVHYGLTKDEINSRKFKRSLYATEEIAAGEIFTSKNIRSIRPSNGLPTKFMPIFIGKTAKKKIAKGTPLSWDLIG
jgi:pseudaminic acid synthase